MAIVTIDGEKYFVLERLGFNHDIGDYAIRVETWEGAKMAVGRPSRGYRFWTAQDRTAPLRDAMSHRGKGQ